MSRGRRRSVQASYDHPHQSVSDASESRGEWIEKACAGPLFRAIVAIAFVGLAVVWNAFEYDSIRGYNAWHNALYVDTLRYEQRMPTRAESGSSHNPPLFFLTAVVLESVADATGWPDEPRRLVQPAHAAAGLGIVLLAYVVRARARARSSACSLADVFREPYAPHFVNRLVPTVAWWYGSGVPCNGRPSERAEGRP